MPRTRSASLKIEQAQAQLPVLKLFLEHLKTKSMHQQAKVQRLKTELATERKAETTLKKSLQEVTQMVEELNTLNTFQDFTDMLKTDENLPASQRLDQDEEVPEFDVSLDLPDPLPKVGKKEKKKKIKKKKIQSFAVVRRAAKRGTNYRKRKFKDLIIPMAILPLAAPSQYELDRAARIQTNQAHLAALGLANGLHV